MIVLHETKRAWVDQFGRKRVWSVVVHLGAMAAPADIETRLSALVHDSKGGAFVSNNGGFIEAALAPLDGGEKLSAVLTELFPGSRVQVIDAASRVVVTPH